MGGDICWLCSVGGGRERMFPPGPEIHPAHALGESVELPLTSQYPRSIPIGESFRLQPRTLREGFDPATTIPATPCHGSPRLGGRVTSMYFPSFSPVSFAPATETELCWHNPTESCSGLSSSCRRALWRDQRLPSLPEKCPASREILCSEKICVVGHST